MGASGALEVGLFVDEDHRVETVAGPGECGGDISATRDRDRAAVNPTLLGQYVVVPLDRQLEAPGAVDRPLSGGEQAGGAELPSRRGRGRLAGGA
jgi:hypothetical protein